MLDYHYETTARILEYLIAQGLRRVDFDGGDAMEVMTFRSGDEEEVCATFNDVLHWMLDEGLIRATLVQAGEYCDYFNGVQLTSKGLALIQQRPSGDESGPTLEESLAEAGKGNIEPSVYVKLGSFIGAAAGGFTKAIS